MPDGDPRRTDAEPAADPASHQVGLAFARTLMGAARATVRTSSALIGFAICEVSRQLEARHLLVGAQLAGRRVGLGMLWLGILLLARGVFSHVRFFRSLDLSRRQLLDLGLLRGAVLYHPIPTFVTAALLFLLGAAAIMVITAQLHG